jgi:hypothetical protein
LLYDVYKDLTLNLNKSDREIKNSIIFIGADYVAPNLISGDFVSSIIIMYQEHVMVLTPNMLGVECIKL